MERAATGQAAVAAGARPPAVSATPLRRSAARRRKAGIVDAELAGFGAKLT
jgi:hypothetical protein